MTKLYILVEHAAGYAVFKVEEFEEIGMLLPQLEAAVDDLSRFNSIVKLVGFSPFKSAISALENINALSEGILPDDLQQFLDITIPKSKKKGKYTLGVADPKLCAAIHEALQITCTNLGAVPEIMRVIRYHFHNLVRGFTETSSGVARLGLSHSYGRAKIKFNVHKEDNMIIQSIALLDQLDKDINTFAMRMREWYSYHFPELVKIVPESYTYARLTKFIRNRKELAEKSLEGLEQITMDSGKAQAILDAARSSMGMDINEIDLANIDTFATRVVSLSEYRKEMAQYLKSKMNEVAPNLGLLIGEQVGARLISHAGSLTKLAKCPASTVQILGAEKALFRALKTRGNTPKYGLIFHSTFIGRAGAKNKGRISRYLANKCAVASRIDCFSEVSSHIFGEKLRQQVEDRLTFYESGEIPKKNIEVMKEAIEEFEKHVVQVKSEEKKKNKKRKAEVLDSSTEQAGEVKSEEKKKKKKRKVEVVDTTEQTGEPSHEPPKKRKRRQSSPTRQEEEEA